MNEADEKVSNENAVNETGGSPSAHPAVRPTGPSARGIAGAPHVMPRCPSCGQPEQLVWVHGHGQCAHCRMNVMPCCDGAVCESG